MNEILGWVTLWKLLQATISFVMAADATATAAPVVKRQNALSWDAFFMALAQLSAQRSKDPSTQVGACIVDADNRVISIGYNGCGFGSL